MLSSALRAYLRSSAPLDYHLTAVIAVVCRNPVTPPELTGDTPVLDAGEPVLIGLDIIVWDELHLALSACLKSGLTHLLHADEPLWLHHRLYCRMASVVGSDCMGVRYYLHQEAELIEIIDHCLPGFITVHACVLAALVIHGTVIIEYIYLFEIVSLAYLEVVRIVCRRDLHAAGSEFLVYV